MDEMAPGSPMEPSVQISVVIDRPIEAVFDLVADTERAPEWQAELVAVKDVSAPPLGPGARMTVVLAFLGRRVENVMQVRAYEPPRRFSLTTLSGYLPVDLDFLLEPAADGTRVTYQGAWGLPAGRWFRLLWPLKPLFDRLDRRQWGSNLTKLKELLEAE